MKKKSKGKHLKESDKKKDGYLVKPQEGKINRTGDIWLKEKKNQKEKSLRLFTRRKKKKKKKYPVNHKKKKKPRMKKKRKGKTLERISYEGKNKRRENAERNI